MRLEKVFNTILRVFKFAVYKRKMMLRYSVLCGASFDAVDAVKLEIPFYYAKIFSSITFVTIYVGLTPSAPISPAARVCPLARGLSDA